MKVCLCVLKKGNKSRYDTYSVKDVSLFIVSVISTQTPFRSGRVGLTPLTENVYWNSCRSSGPKLLYECLWLISRYLGVLSSKMRRIANDQHRILGKVIMKLQGIYEQSRRIQISVPKYSAINWVINSVITRCLPR